MHLWRRMSVVQIHPDPPVSGLVSWKAGPATLKNGGVNLDDSCKNENTEAVAVATATATACRNPHGVAVLKLTEIKRKRVPATSGGQFTGWTIGILA